MTVTRRDIDEATGDEIVVAGAVQRVPHRSRCSTKANSSPHPTCPNAAADAAHRRRPLAARLGRRRRPARRRGLPRRAAHRPPRSRRGTAAPTSTTATSRSWTTSTPRNASRPCCTNGPTSRCATATPTARATRELLEIEAESVAYLLCRTIGLRLLQLLDPLPRRLVRRRPRARRRPPPSASSPPPPRWSTPSKHELSIDLTPDLFSATRPAPAPPSTTPAVTDPPPGSIRGRRP